MTRTASILIFLAIVLATSRSCCGSLTPKDRYVVTLKEGYKLDHDVSSWLQTRGAIFALDMPAFRAFAAYIPGEHLEELRRAEFAANVEKDPQRKFLRLPHGTPHGPRQFHNSEGDEGSRRELRGRRRPTFNVDPGYCPDKGYDHQEVPPWAAYAFRLQKVPSNQIAKIKICVIDSGFDKNHPDLQGNNVTGYALNFNTVSFDGMDFANKTFRERIGERFDPTVGDPYVDWAGHGTSVLGVMAAVQNGMGTRGVIGNGRARVHMIKPVTYTADGGETQMAFGSNVLNILHQCQRVGANVISMSFGSPDNYIQLEADYIEKLYFRKNILLFAASGNSGVDEMFFPASYRGVVSVGAITEGMQAANFSTFNERIDFGAPGNDYLTTAPTNQNTSIADYGTCAVMSASAFGLKTAYIVRGSALGSVNAPVADCQRGLTPCVGVKGKICLVERGINAFSEKVTNCKQGGAIAVIIWNNEQENTNYFMLDPLIPGFIVLAIRQQDSVLLKAAMAADKDMVVHVDTGMKQNYIYESGTSFAAPATAAIAALLWSNFPLCKNWEILGSMAKTALDIYPWGKDIYSGFGLPQAQPAYRFLKFNPCRAYRKNRKRKTST